MVVGGSSRGWPVGGGVAPATLAQPWPSSAMAVGFGEIFSRSRSRRSPRHGRRTHPRPRQRRQRGAFQAGDPRPIVSVSARARPVRCFIATMLVGSCLGGAVVVLERQLDDTGTASPHADPPRTSTSPARVRSGSGVARPGQVIGSTAMPCSPLWSASPCPRTPAPTEPRVAPHVDAGSRNVTVTVHRPSGLARIRVCRVEALRAQHLGSRSVSVPRQVRAVG